jgi:addiction module HigA family antidote
MPEYKVTRPIRRPPTHPGRLMHEILRAHVRMAVAQAARRMGVSRPSLYAVLNGEGAVTADMALRFARLVGGAPELFLRMQDNHDLWRARRRLSRKLERIVPAAAE